MPVAGPGSDICGRPAVELARLVREGELSPVEVVEAYLERIAAVDPEVNAYVTVLDRDARERARAAERAVRSGEALGPLHGVPVAVKDHFDLKAGAPHTFGFLPPGRFVPDRSSVGVERLERAGAIVLGKTAACALGHKLTTDGRLHGPTSTPSAPGWNAGGSSGGSAAAVAAGMAAAALGSDAAGSVRLPASMCGVIGLKPTWGRIPSAGRPNAFRSLTPLGQPGPLARTAEDAACLLDVLAGPHARDPFALPPPATPFATAARRPVEGMRVAYSRDLGSYPVAEEVVAVVDRAAERLAAQGVHVDRVDASLPLAHDEITRIVRRLLGLGIGDAFAMLEQLGIDVRDPDAPVDDDVLAMVAETEGVSALDLKRDEVRRTALLDALEDLLDGHDALLTPVALVAGVPNATDGGTVGPASVGGTPVDPLLGWSLAAPANLTGHPAASAPAGVAPSGVPVGAQIVGRRFDEATVLALAGAVAA